jgi:hypothetical protein
MLAHAAAAPVVSTPRWSTGVYTRLSGNRLQPNPWPVRINRTKGNLELLE